MIEIKQILLPTDLSAAAAEATNHACELASRFNATLHVLHVLTDPSTWFPDFWMGLDFSELTNRISASYRKHAELEAASQLSKVLDPEWQKRNSALLATKAGTPFTEIIAYAKSHQIDLIVMSTHGRSGIPHVLIGSVTERVVRMAPCPVLTVRPAGRHFVMP